MCEAENNARNRHLTVQIVKFEFTLAQIHLKLHILYTPITAH